MIDPFRKKDPLRERQVELEREVKDNLRSLSLVAKDILLDTRYAQFAGLVKVAEENTLALLWQMHKTSFPDRLRKYDELLTELAVYRNILNSALDLSNPDNVKREKVDFVQKFKKDFSSLLGGS